MKHIKISLIDNDYAIQAKTGLDFNEAQDKTFSKFVECLKEELVTGQTARIEIDGLLNESVVFSIAEST